MTRPAPSGNTVALTVLAPVAGRVVPLAAVPDPVFATGLVGSGAAIDPVHRGRSEAIAPLSGTVFRLHPHAFVIRTEPGAAVLVHLGIDTVQLAGAGFEPRVAENDEVAAGDPIVTWDPAQVAATGRSPLCVVVALDAAAGSLAGLIAGGSVDSRSTLFTWHR
jgi:sugar PTS system EIIA component